MKGMIFSLPFNVFLKLFLNLIIIFAKLFLHSIEK